MTTTSELKTKSKFARPGNKLGVALKDPEIRQKAYQQYCDHLAQGKSKNSWYFDHPSLHCTHKTMEKYLKNETEFPPIHKEIAEAKGFGVWEQIVEDSAKGINKEANTASLQMLMRNKFGWDKQEEKAAVAEEINIQYNSLLTQLKKLQLESQEKEKVV